MCLVFLILKISNKTILFDSILYRLCRENVNAVYNVDAYLESEVYCLIY